MRWLGRASGPLAGIDHWLTFKRARTYAVVLVALYVAAWLDVLVLGTPPLNSSGTPIGGDYIAFHAAGRLVLSGQAAALYDRAAIMQVQDQLLGGRIPGFYDAFRNPPFFALLYAPLALLGLLPGFATWTLISMACLGVSIWLGAREEPWLRARWRGLVILVLAFPPLYFGLIDGQNVTLSLLLYVLIYRALVDGHPTSAGAWAAVGLFKPQLFVVVFPLIFIASRRWRALGGYVLVVAALLGLSLVMVGTDGLEAWFRIVIEPESGNATANAWRMTSLKSFFELLVPGPTWIPLGLYAISAVALLALLAREWTQQRLPLPLAWAVTTQVAVLVDPHLVDYDLTVLIAAALAAPALVHHTRWWTVLLYALLLVRAQLPLDNHPVQLAVLTLTGCMYLAWRSLRHNAPALPWSN